MTEFKTVYSYDKYTKEYLGEQNAYLCPVTQAEYHMPASSTEVKPSKHKDGFARVFINGQWEYVEDKRGAAMYDCTTGAIIGYIDGLVYVVPEGYTLKVPKKDDVWIDNEWKPKPPLTVEQRKDQRKINIQAAMRAEADEMIPEVLAGEIDKQVWLNKRNEIKQRFPKEE
jgi:hypothetical protein